MEMSTAQSVLCVDEKRGNKGISGNCCAFSTLRGVVSSEATVVVSGHCPVNWQGCPGEMCLGNAVRDPCAGNGERRGECYATDFCSIRNPGKPAGAGSYRILPFVRHRRVIFRAASVVEDWSMRVRASHGSRWTFPGPTMGSHGVHHSARPSRSWRKKSSSSCISCSGLKSSSRRGRRAASPVAS